MSTDTPRDPAETPHSVAAARREVVHAGHTGDVPTARTALADPRPSVRASAVGALSRLGELDPGTTEEFLRDPDPAVRRRTALEAARGGGAPSDALVDLLGDPDPSVADAAAFALGELDPTPEAVRRLSAMATAHSDSLCREAAVAALGSLGDPAGTTAVLSACTDRAPVRRRAVLALAAFDGPEVSDMLRHLTADRDIQVRQAAEDLLAIEAGEDVGGA